jgi:hypothetical protein
MADPPSMMTEVVPSPTSSSCVRLSSMMDCSRACALLCPPFYPLYRPLLRCSSSAVWTAQIDVPPDRMLEPRPTDLCRWVRDIDLPQDRVAVVRDDDACRGTALAQACAIIMFAATWQHHHNNWLPRQQSPQVHMVHRAVCSCVRGTNSQLLHLR